jgi:hypothetical protein
MVLIKTEEPMRKISQNKKVFGIALLLGGLVVGGFPVVGVSEAKELHSLNRDVVLLDCVEDANAFVVKTVSSTLDVDIHQGLDCAAAVKILFARSFLLGPGIGGATSADAASLNHFLMLFVLDINSLLEPRIDTPLLNPTQPCVLGQTLVGCPQSLDRTEPLSPILNNQEPLPPILQQSSPLRRSGR